MPLLLSVFAGDKMKKTDWEMHQTEPGSAAEATLLVPR